MSAELAWRWQDQAANDLAFARLAVREGFFSQACFMSQQAAEKSLKALHYAAGARAVLGHSCVALLDGLVAQGRAALGSHRTGASSLDQLYIPARYPNGLPAGIPATVFVRPQAEAAVTAAEGILASVAALLPVHP